MNYRKKPVVIQAVQFDGTGDMPEVELHMIDSDTDWVCQICGKPSRLHGNVKTLEGFHIACPGDWIITGVEGEHYPCKPDIFEKTYEAVQEIPTERFLDIGTKKYTAVICLDKPGAGGACHKYQVVPVMPLNGSDDFSPFAKVSFQNGPIKENGVNGCHQEDLLAIVIDRLQHFQKGEYACRENAIALTKIEEAMMWLRKRTQDRLDRGVEGTSQK